MQKEPVVSLKKDKRVQVKRVEEQIQEASFPEEQHLAADTLARNLRTITN